MIILHQTNQESVTDRHPRRSFTLIELLMVIVIISILMSLALAAYSSVMTRARVAEVKVEIDGLSSALATFKAKFGFYPPSTIVLVENPTSTSPWPTKSRAVIRRMFPQFNFNVQNEIDGDLPNTPGYKSESFILTGAECLVFFLGGVLKDGVPNGFSNNPLFPFSNAGTSRIRPFFDFDAGRLRRGRTNGLLVFKSPVSQMNPYRYYSAYDGTGYRCAEVRQYLSTFGLFDVYRQTESEDINRNCRLDDGEDRNNNGRLDFGQPWKPKSFQIICPGFDDQYGRGGKYDPNSADLDLSEKDRDNITSFHTGILAP